MDWVPLEAVRSRRRCYGGGSEWRRRGRGCRVRVERGGGGRRAEESRRGGQKWVPVAVPASPWALPMATVVASESEFEGISVNLARLSLLFQVPIFQLSVYVFTILLYKGFTVFFLFPDNYNASRFE